MASRRARAVAERLRGVDGAIDLASIMIGVVVLAALTGTLTASIYSIVPWSQDRTAEQSLSTVVSKQSIAKIKHQKYVDLDQLVISDLVARTDSVAVETSAAGTCFLAAAVSETGTHFWVESADRQVRQHTPDATSQCGDLAALIATLP